MRERNGVRTAVEKGLRRASNALMPRGHLSNGEAEPKPAHDASMGTQPLPLELRQLTSTCTSDSSDEGEPREVDDVLDVATPQMPTPEPPRPPSPPPATPDAEKAASGAPSSSSKRVSFQEDEDEVIGETAPACSSHSHAKSQPKAATGASPSAETSRAENAGEREWGGLASALASLWPRGDSEPLREAARALLAEADASDSEEWVHRLAVEQAASLPFVLALEAEASRLRLSENQNENPGP